MTSAPERLADERGPAFLGARVVGTIERRGRYSESAQIWLDEGRPLALSDAAHAKTDTVDGGED